MKVNSLNSFDVWSFLLYGPFWGPIDAIRAFEYTPGSSGMLDSPSAVNAANSSNDLHPFLSSAGKSFGTIAAEAVIIGAIGFFIFKAVEKRI